MEKCGETKGVVSNRPERLVVAIAVEEHNLLATRPGLDVLDLPGFPATSLVTNVEQPLCARTFLSLLKVADAASLLSELSW